MFLLSFVCSADLIFYICCVIVFACAFSDCVVSCVEFDVSCQVSQLLRPSVKDSNSSHEYCLVVEDSADRFPSMSLAFPDIKVCLVRLVARAAQLFRRLVSIWVDASHTSIHFCHIPVGGAASVGWYCDEKRMVVYAVIRSKYILRSTCWYM